ncbi:MAG: zinc ribbon domain-containing protein [Candidatus Gastranaerophilales bacterium]|nr:zinc ribbon domain-containing protein [Candidatus Gastranaerophilales bacterium]
MNCPKCKNIITPDDFFCPGCGKLVQIECPRCGTVNQKSVCSKCKLKLIVRCQKCDEKNLVTLKYCKKCNNKMPIADDSIGFKLNKFAIIGLEILNHEELKNDIGKDFAQYEKAVKSYIQMEASKNNAQIKQINDNLIVISFNQDDTMYESCKNSLAFAIECYKFLVKINNKLKKAFNCIFKVKMGVSISNILDRRGIARNERSIIVNEDILIVVHHLIYKNNAGKYKFNHLASIMINNQLTPLYQLDTNFFLETQKEEVTKKISVKWEDMDDFEGYDDYKFEFADKKRQTLSIPVSQAKKELIGICKATEDFKLVNFIGNKEKGIKFELNRVDFLTQNKNMKLYKVFAESDDNLTPFGVIKKIIEGILNLSEFSINHEKRLSYIKSSLTTILGSEFKELENLLTLNGNNKKNIEEIQYNLFNQVAKIINTVGNNKISILIIENFDNIDKASLECLNCLMEERLINVNFTIAIATNIDYKLSDKLYTINNYPCYAKIFLKKESLSDINEFLRGKVSEYEDNFNIAKLIENSCGSLSFINHGLNYIADYDILRLKNGILYITSDEIIPIPNNIDDIIEKRILLLKNSFDLFELYLKIILLGSEFDLNLLKYILSEEIIDEELRILEEKGFIQKFDNKKIFIENYNDYKKNILKIATNEQLSGAINLLCEKFGITKTYVHPANIEFLELLNQKNDAIKLLNMMNVKGLGIGDIYSYTSCFEKMMEMLGINFNNIKNLKYTEAIKKILTDFALHTGELLYESNPDIAIKYLPIAIMKFEEEKDEKQTIALLSKMTKACNLVGDYEKAINYLSKILSRISSDKLDVKNKNFESKYYLLNFLRIQILYNSGRFQQCIELSDKVFEVFNIIKKNNLLQDKSSNCYMDSIIVDVLTYKAKSELFMLDKNFDDTINLLINTDDSKKEFAEVLKLGKKIIQGADNDAIEKISNKVIVGNLKKDELLYAKIFKILAKIQTESWQIAFNTAYSAKFLANEIKDYQKMYLLDLIIAMFYNVFGNTRKAKNICNDVLKIAVEKKLINLVLCSWYLLANIEFANNPQKSFEIVSKVNVMLEQDNSLSKLFVVIFKTFLAKILLAKKDINNAQNCIDQAKYITKNYDLKYNNINAFLVNIKIIAEIMKNQKNKEEFAKYHNIFKEMIEKTNESIQELENIALSNKLNTGGS